MMNTTPTSNTTNATPTHSVTLNGETRLATVDTYQGICEELIAKHGGGVPQVLPIAAATPMSAPAPASAPAPVATIAVPTPAPLAVEAGRVCIVGQARSMTDTDTAIASGFAPAQPLFTRGTRVNSTGVDNARRSRCEHDAKPTVAEYCTDFIGQIADEHRRDVDARTGALRMDKEGRLVMPNGDRVLMTRRSLDGLTYRLGVGGTTYLAKCKPELRAININHHCRDLQTVEDADNAADAATNPDRHTDAVSMSKVRVRDGRKGVEAFGVVSDSYTPFDVDRIADALRLAAPADARGTVTYDGTRARFEVAFHTDVQPEEFVAGEYFKAVAIVETADDGTGGIRVSAALFQNLCLNLIVIDTAKQYTANIRHVGSVEVLAERFRAGFEAALEKIGPFMRQWGYACHEDALARAAKAAEVELPTTDTGAVDIRAALPGLFNAIIERELVPVKLNGRKRADVIASLVQKFDADDSSARRNPDGTDRGIVTRAAVANAFTRFAHEEPQSSPWDEDEIQRAAGALLWPQGRATTPAPLPYIPFE